MNIKNKYLFLWIGIPMLFLPFLGNQYLPKIVYAGIVSAIFSFLLCCKKKSNFSCNVSHLLIILFVVSLGLNTNGSWDVFFYWVLLLCIHSIFSHLKETEINIVLNCFVLSGVMSSIYGIFQFFAYERIHSFPVHTAFFTNINVAAAFVSCITLITLSILIINKNLKFKWLYILALLIDISYLVSTQNRACWLACIIGFVVLSIFVSSQKIKITTKTKLAIVSTFAIIIAIFIFNNDLNKQISSVFDMTNNASNKVRLSMWNSTLNMSTDHLLLGVGTGDFIYFFPEYRDAKEYSLSLGRVASHPHNSFLLILSENGLVGLFLFVCLLLVSFLQICKNIPKKPIYLISLITLITLFVNALFFSVLLAPAIGVLFAILLGVSSHGLKNISFSGRYVFGFLFLCCVAGIGVSGTHMVANIFFHEGQKEMKNDRFYKAISNLQKANYLWNDGQTNLELGRCYLMQKKYEKARNYLEKSLQQGNWENGYLNLGICYVQQNKKSKAMEIWQECILLYPNSILANYNLAKLFLELNKAKKALLYFEIAKKLSPKLEDSVDYFMNLGIAYESLKKYRLALSSYIKAKEMDKRKIVPTIYIAKIFVKLGLYDVALHHFDVVATSGTADEIITANINIANIYDMKKKPNVAMTYYWKVIQQDPNNYQGNFLLGRLLFFQKKYKMAQKILQKASFCDSTSPWPYVFIALIMLEKDNENGENYLNKAKEMQFTSWQALMDINVISQKTKEKLEKWRKKWK